MNDPFTSGRHDRDAAMDQTVRHRNTILAPQKDLTTLPEDDSVRRGTLHLSGPGCLPAVQGSLNRREPGGAGVSAHAFPSACLSSCQILREDLLVADAHGEVPMTYS